MEEKIDELESVKPFDPSEFKKEADSKATYVKFNEGEQKDLVVTNPQNVRTRKFDKKEEKLVLRLQVLTMNGTPCDPVKEWDVTNGKLIAELSHIFAVKKDAYRLIVKRGFGQNKATNYTVMEV